VARAPPTSTTIGDAAAVKGATAKLLSSNAQKKSRFTTASSSST
jgi:hypothetical protein